MEKDIEFAGTILDKAAFSTKGGIWHIKPAKKVDGILVNVKHLIPHRVVKKHVKMSFAAWLKYLSRMTK